METISDNYTLATAQKFKVIARSRINNIKTKRNINNVTSQDGITHIQNVSTQYIYKSHCMIYAYNG